jgi:hypothetical protein
MKVRNSFKKMVLAGALVGFSVAASASTYYDNVTSSFNLGVGAGLQENYVGNVNVGGLDSWTINLLAPAGLTVDITTSQDTGIVNPQDLPTAIATLANITRVDLVNSSNVVVGGANAVYALTNFGDLSTLTSFVNFSVGSLLMPGAYTLKIYGDDGAAYSGTISAVPLPAAAWLFGSALLGLGAMRRKQKGAVKSEIALA